jgi:phosphoribosylformylglycinamidine cyclo-ligase
MSKQYEQAGVSLNKGYETIQRIQKHTKGIGAFGGVFDLSALNLKQPVLVSGTDGVGTKLKLAHILQKHDTIGIDLVAMCANDIITQGATPLFFLDYFATSDLDPKIVETVIEGIVKGCATSHARLIGGETAEMPGMYQDKDYDLAGFMVGACEKKDLIDPSNVKQNDVLIGLPSSGIHSNGYSLVRKILLKDHKLDLSTVYPPCTKPLQEILLTPTTIYVEPILTLLKTIKIHSMAHITGGGFYENIPRALPKHLGASIDTSTIKVPPIFTLLETLGNIDHDEMYHIFNMGIGMVLIVDPSDVKTVLNTLKNASVIGQVTNQAGVVLK